MSDEDFRRTHSLRLDRRDKSDCPCGCGQRLPRLEGEISGPDGRHVIEAAFVHHEGRRRVLVGLSGPLLAQDCAAWAFLNEAAQTSYQQAGAIHPGLLRKVSRPAAVKSEERMGALLQLLDVLMFNSPDASCHLAGPTEATRQALDFSFRLPDALLKVPRDQRQVEPNFARLGDRRFLRALLPLPVLGGEEFRIGMWFEVSAPAYEAVGRHEPGALSGTADNGFSIGGQPLKGIVAALALAPGQPCPTVRGASVEWLSQAMREVRSSDEHFALVREITDSYLRAMATP